MKLHNLNDVVGQTQLIRWLQSMVDKDKLPKVLLLAGKPGIGKSSIAKIVASEVSCKGSNNLLAQTKKAIIDNSQNTSSVRLYNMSNLKSQDAVLEVRADLTVGLSETGRKVIILDEAHGMNDAAQDALLVAFETLPENVWVIICSTDVAQFRDAFLSRCIVRNLIPLTAKELKELAVREIASLGLEFAIPQNMVMAYIMAYCGTEPRRMINLLTSLDSSRKVSKDDLIAATNLEDDHTVVTLVRYLYQNDILSGLQFINDMATGFTPTVIQMLLEIVKVMFGHTTYLLTRDTVDYIQSLKTEYGVEKLLKFVSKVSITDRPTKNRVSGYFIECCMEDFNHQPQMSMSNDSGSRIEDIGLMSKMLERKEVNATGVKQAPSLESLMSQADSIL